MRFNKLNCINKRAGYKKFAFLLVLLILIAGFSVWLFWPVKKIDIAFNFISALNSKDTAYCEKIALLGPRQRCIAIVTNNAELCNVAESLKNDSCIAVIKKDVSLCGYDVLCKALVTGNPDECIEVLTEMEDNEKDKKLAKAHCISYATKNPRLTDVENIYRFDFLNRLIN